MTSRTWSPRQLPHFYGLNSFPPLPEAGEKSLLILLHGVGSNEEALLQEGEVISPSSESLSLRGPYQLGRIAFAWFHVDFTAQGPVHQGAEAIETLEKLTQEIKTISEQEQIPIHRILVGGFSQGAIMTLGLYLQGELDLGGYLAFSGRVLPEFASYARKGLQIPTQRKLFLAHGTHDTVVPFSRVAETKQLLEDLGGTFEYHDYPNAHDISDQGREDAAHWVSKILT